MASKTIYLSGEASWAKVHRPDEKYENYNIVLALDDASLVKFKDSGLRLSLKDDNKIALRRSVRSIVKGETVEWGPPAVLDKDNNPTDALIGNGSKVTCKVVVYDTVKGKGHRLEAVRVEDLVTYEPNEVIDSPF